MEDTIAAVATAPGEGAIAVVRISGTDAIRLTGSVFRSRRGIETQESHTVALGRVMRDGRLIDEALATVFRSPASYTGEDVVELSCHGGVLVTAQVLEAILRAGARLARPGEFTERAFLNGKLDLTQAEAVMDTIRAQTTLALDAANIQRGGRLSRTMHELRAPLLETLAHLEASIDFPEEGISPDSFAALLARIETLSQRVQRLLETSNDGRILREGVRVALVGAPNAGKSSLLNRLLGWERAIVHASPGTTRDTVEETASLRGLPFRLIDTAGLRTTTDPVEQAGISRTRLALEQCDLALHVVDAQSWPVAVDAGHPREILVLNKIDISGIPQEAPADAVCVSCVTGEGLPALVDRLASEFAPGAAQRAESGVAINARHRVCLEKAADALRETQVLLTSNAPAEIVAIEMRAALGALGDVVGHADPEELLGEIFGAFCIGK